MQRTPDATRPRAWRALFTKLAVSILALTMISAVGCSSADSNATAPDEHVTGIYTLQQIEGGAVPVRVYRGPYHDKVDNRDYAVFDLTIAGGTYTLDEDGEYHSALNYVLFKDAQQETGVLRQDGTYEVDSGELLFFIDGRPVGLGFVSDDGTLTMGLDVVAKGTNKTYLFKK